MTRSVILAVSIALLASLVGCKSHDELVVDVVCSSICPCFSDPGEASECLAECEAQIDPGTVSDACFQCVLEASGSCPEVDACEPLCSGI
ncbi:MAG TPA: hypothetical protein VM261_26135 [Kofleriaceae bacterium]|nr:hypothetical protein [Kofleriaceae bacterium]